MPLGGAGTPRARARLPLPCEAPGAVCPDNERIPSRGGYVAVNTLLCNSKGEIVAWGGDPQEKAEVRAGSFHIAFNFNFEKALARGVYVSQFPQHSLLK